MEAEFKYEGKSFWILCGGSLIDPSHILTAAHCAFDPANGQALSAAKFAVLGGTSSFTAAAIETSTTVQASLVAGVRVHPEFRYSAGPGTPDDVAVLTLSKPFTDTASVLPIGLVSGNSTPPEGMPVGLTGFGQQNPESQPNGQLYSLAMTLGFSGLCGGEADAVFLCAAAPGGSACSGDSGSGLTSGSPATLVGVLSTVEGRSGESCVAGGDNGFTNIAAPEIRDFIEGDGSPPAAPRGGGASIAFTNAERAAVCDTGSWSGSPTFTYTFLDSISGQVLQSGSSSTYAFVSSDEGRKIYCEVQAGNAGGTDVERTAVLGAITHAPEAWVGSRAQEGALEEAARAKRQQEEQEAANRLPPPISGKGASCGEEGVTCPGEEVALADASIVVQKDGTALVKLNCTGSQDCSGKLTLSAKKTSRAKHGRRRSRTITIGTAKFSIVAGETAAVQIKLDGAGRSLLGAGHGRFTARLTILELAPNPASTTAVTVRLTRRK